MSDSLPHNTNEGSVIPVRFTRVYMTLLLTLVILLTVGQVLTQWRIRAVQDELWVIRYTALQRHQSQQIVKQALQVTDAGEQASFADNVAELKSLFPVFERYHIQSREGRVYEYNVQITNSPKVQQLYKDIRPHFNAFRKSADRLMRLKSFDEIRHPDVQASLRLMLANEKPFLEKIDGIVREYTGEMRAKLTQLESIELYLYLSTVIVLIGFGWLVFRPATQKLKQTFAQVVEAESQTAAVNKKLLNANRVLKETRQKLFEATKQQYQQQIDEQKLRTSYLIAGQEEERKRMSRELHDGLGQMLTAIKLQLEGLEASIIRTAGTEPDVTIPHAKNMKTLKSLITQTIQETRAISNDLMPTVLSDFGIVPALKMLAEHDRNEKISVTFDTNLTPDLPRLDKNVEIMLYRVTQEAVSNAVRHANPSTINIELMEKGKTLQLLVSDDGRGFRIARKKQDNELMKSLHDTNSDIVPAGELRPPSQGLHNIQERTKLLDGKFKIHSTLGKGTKIQVTIPYQTHLQHHDTY